MADAALAIPEHRPTDYCLRWKVAEMAIFGSALREDVRRALETGDIIESYPDDEPYPSRLVLG